MKRNFMVLLVLFFAVLVFAKDYGTIKGTVLFENELPLANFEVYFSGKSRLKAITDENGQYVIKNVPKGKYSGVAKFRFTESIRKEEVFAQKNGTTEVDFILPKNQTSSFRSKALIGVVTDNESKQPLKNAKILVNVNSKTQGAESSLQGIYYFEHIEGDVANVVCEVEGYERQVKYRSVFSNGVVKRLDFELEKKPELTTQIFKITYGEVNGIGSQVEHLLGAGGNVNRSGSQSLTVNATKAKMSEVEDFIRNHDTPPKRIWLEVRLILASNSAKQSTRFPKEIESVSKQLTTLFKYNNYELLDDAKVQTLEKKSCQFLSGKGNYRIAMGDVEYKAVNGGLIQLKHFELLKKGENSPILATSVNIPNGDTLILGASSTDASGKALITAVTAKILN